MANALLEALKPKKSKAPIDDSFLQDNEDGPGLLSRIGSTALSGVSAVGNFVGIPGSMVRDTLGGEDPFDQLLTPFHDTNRLTGRDLLRKHGLVGQEDTYANWWAGTGTELITDPTTYLGIGALTKTGKAVKAAGLLGDAALDTAKLSSRIGGSIKKVASATAKLGGDDAVDALRALGTAAKSHGVDLLDEGPLQSLLHLGIPGTDIGVHIGTGERALKLASQIDKLGDATKALAPVRAARMLFDPSVKGKYDLAEQIVAQAQYAKADQAIKVARLNQVDNLRQMNDLWKDFALHFRILWRDAGRIPEEVSRARSIFNRTLRMGHELGGDFDTAFRYLSKNESASLPAALRDKFKRLSKDAARQRYVLANAARSKGATFNFLGELDDDLADAGGAVPSSPKPTPSPSPATVSPAVSEVLQAASPKGKSLFRETSARDADEFIPNSSASGGWTYGPPSVFLSDNPDLAIGQGSNRGVVLHFDSDGLKINEHIKPGTQVPGVGKEFTTKEFPSNMRNNLLSVTIKKGTEKAEKANTIRIKRLLDQNGWIKEKLDNGDIRYSRPEKSTSAAMPTQVAESQAIPEGLGGFGHHPRYIDYAKTYDKTKNLATRSGSMMHRDEAIRFVPTEVVNDILTDPAARGEDAVKYISDKWGKFLGKGFEGNVKEHAEKLTKWAADQKEVELFTREAQDDHFKYLLGMSVANKNLDAMHSLLMTHAAPGKAYSIPKVLRDAGLDVDRAINHLSSLSGKSVQQLSEMGLDEDMAKAIIGSQRAVNNPIWAGKIAEAVDKFNQAFKQGVTLPFPSFWTRNFMGGQYTNLAASGEFNSISDLAAYGKWMGQMTKAAKEGVDPKLMEELYVHNVFRPDQLAQDVAANLPENAAGWGMPLTGPANPLGIRQTWQQAGDPIKDSVMRGILGDKLVDRVNATPFGKVGQAYHTVVGTGSKASQWVEWANRVPMYMYLTREKGWDALAAAQKVAELQIDYSKLAPFEKDVMRRLVPFYSFQRKIAPVLFNTLLKRPGGMLAQTIRLENRAHGENDALLPEHVASTLAIPNPWKTPEEGQSYITGFGLPFEQTAQYLGNFPSLREAGREFLSQTTPLVKAPLEWASGQSFFQSGSGGAGRPLEELDPTIARTISNVTGAKVDTPDLLEFALSNSPASRVLTQARTLSDTRKTAGEKALNLLTGVRVTDVSPAAEDAVLRERAKDVMKKMGAKSFEKVYFSKDDLAAMTPEQRAEAEKFQALMHLLSMQAKERKKAKQK